LAQYTEHRNQVSLGKKLRQIYYSWNPPEDLTLMGTALVVGLTTGLGAVAFRYLIAAVGWFGYQYVPDTFPWLGKNYVLIIPTLGGLLVGLLVYYFAREAKGHGVPEVMEAVALRGGRIRPIVVVIKVLASSLSIGSGGSVGREGPIVQIGSTLGSVIGQRLGLSDDRIRNLVACGAAAGIAATFNAPIAGVLFALEIILGEFGVRYFSSVVVSAVVSSVIGRLVFGNNPAFVIPAEYGVSSLWEFALYPILGVLAALLGVLYTRAIYWAEDLFDDWKGVIEWVKPAVGGLLLGGMALLYPRLIGLQWDRIPQVFNVGYEVIESAMANQLTLKIALALLVLKLIATSLTLGSGGSGGVFAPALFIGAMFGVVFGNLVQLIFPGMAVSPGAYALVGMGAVFAASAHAPITAIIILFELTGDYRIILPLMLTVVLSTILSQLLLKGESIYTLKLSRRGIRLQRGRDIDVLQGVLVSEVMTQEYYRVDIDSPLKDAWELMNQAHTHSVLVCHKNGDLHGILTLSDVERGMHMGHLEDGIAGDYSTGHNRLVVAYPNESVGQVLSRMGIRDLTRAPVVSVDESHKLLGMIRREDIIRAYNLGLARRSEIRERTAQKQVTAVEGVEFVDFFLEEGDQAVNKTVGGLGESLPKDCILVSIQREGHRLIPHGDTVFQVGDMVTAYVENHEVATLRDCLKGPEKVQKA
jgi:CIC family chloride channel protein